MHDKQFVLEALANHKKRHERIVFTNGCFDILHVGHARYLAEARALGDVLVVGLNSDESVRALNKGASRPIVPGAERAEMLCALSAVDYVIEFAEETPYELIREVQPDILVKGGDWAVEEIVGSDLVLATGGTVKSLQFVEGKSTTNIEEKIKMAVRS